MKRLYLVRHAKSSWSTPGMADFDRPLNKRGKRDAPIMGAYLKEEKKVAPDCVLCSTAKRARATARRLLEALGYPKDRVIWHDIIYSGNADDVLRLVRGVDAACHEVMVIGHNPDMTELAQALTGERFDNVPTCGVVGIVFDVNQWADVKSGKLIFFEVPKLI